MPYPEAKHHSPEEFRALEFQGWSDRLLRMWNNQQKSFTELREKTKNLEPREVVGMLMGLPIPSKNGHHYINFAEFSDKVLFPIYRLAGYHPVSGEKLSDSTHFDHAINVGPIFDTESIRFGVDNAVHIQGQVLSNQSRSDSKSHPTNDVFLLACPEIMDTDAYPLVHKYLEQKYPENEFQEAKGLRLTGVTFMLFDNAQFEKLKDVLAPEKPPDYP